MTTYHVPIMDMRFLARSNNIADASQVEMILAEAAKMAQQQWLQSNSIGDKTGCALEGGKVKLANEVKGTFHQYATAGWMGLTMPEQWGGQQQSEVVGSFVGEMLTSSNHALSMLPALTMSACRAIIGHGNDELKNTYLPPIIEGRWSATMCMTEAHCGSDLGLVHTKAEPVSCNKAHEGDHSFHINGSKIFISYGHHDASDNIIHLVLARLPDAPNGIKGLSLFLVPEKRTDAQQNWQLDNGVRCIGIEEKMGIHASPTCSLSFDNSLGYLIGEAHGGIKAMFTMMNEMRLGTCLQGVGLSERSHQESLMYAKERRQMRSLSGIKSPQHEADTLVEHPDVRRMLLTQKAFADGGRALANYCAQLLDQQDNQEALQLLDFLTPIAKGFCTEVGLESASHGIQIYGGHGFIRDNGVEQLYRDGRIATLYEGTTGIQALDLLGRKVLGNQGASMRLFTKKMYLLCKENESHSALADLVSGLAPYSKVWPDLSMKIGMKAMANHDEVGAASFDFLMYSGYVVLGYFHLKMALEAHELLNQEDYSHEEFSTEFLEHKIYLANFYLKRILPRASAHAESMLADITSLDAIW